MNDRRVTPPIPLTKITEDALRPTPERLMYG